MPKREGNELNQLTLNVEEAIQVGDAVDPDATFEVAPKVVLAQRRIVKARRAVRPAAVVPAAIAASAVTDDEETEEEPVAINPVANLGSTHPTVPASSFVTEDKLVEVLVRLGAMNRELIGGLAANQESQAAMMQQGFNRLGQQIAKLHERCTVLERSNDKILRHLANRKDNLDDDDDTVKGQEEDLKAAASL